MTNEKIKSQLLKAIEKLMPRTKVAAEIAARSGFAVPYVYRWMNKTEMIHPQIEEKALELLQELKAEAAARIETINS